jgi:O-antigen/teichoic acid export membrane protein
LENYSKHFGKILLLLGTGLPGLTKLIAILWVKETAGSEVLGEVLSDINIATMFTYFTAIGWAIILINRVAVTKNSCEQFAIINGIMIQTILAILISCLALAVLFYIGVTKNLVNSVIFVIGYSSYQLIRHFYFGKKEPLSLCFLELSILLISIAGLYFFSDSSQLLAYIFSVPLMLVAVVWFLSETYRLMAEKAPIFEYQKNVTDKALYFGLANMASSGSLLLLVPVVNGYSNSTYAALVGLIVTLVGMVLIFSRTITSYYLPLMALSYQEKNYNIFEQQIKNCRKISISSIILMAIFLFLVCKISGPIFYPDLYELKWSITILVILILNIIVAQVSLPDAAVIVVQEKSKLSVCINIIDFLFFAFFAGIISLVHGDTIKIVFLLVSMLFCQIAKTFYMGMHTRRFFKDVQYINKQIHT